MGKKKVGEDQSLTKTAQFWCYYCDRRCEDEFALLEHQRLKHFLCRLCDEKDFGRKCLSLNGLICHVRRAHKTELSEVPGAIMGRKSLETKVLGMNGIPPEAHKEFEEKFAEELMREKKNWAEELVKGTLVKKPQPAPPDPDLICDPDLITDPDLINDDDDGDLIGQPQGFQKLRLTQPLPSPHLAMLATSLRRQVAEHAPQPKTTNSNQGLQAFDPSLLAKALAAAEATKGQKTDKELVEEARNEYEVNSKKEIAERKKAEARRKAMAMAFVQEEEEVPKEVAKPVVRVDKSAVDVLGSAVAARAARAAEAAAAAKAAPPPLSIVKRSLRTKLKAMEIGALVRYAREIGIKDEDLDKATDAEDPRECITELALELEGKENWMLVTFRPGKVGLKGDWPNRKVKAVTTNGQADIHGVKVGMVFLRIDDRKFCKKRFQAKVAGLLDYKVIFVTTPVVDRSPKDYVPRPRGVLRDRSRSPRARERELESMPPVYDDQEPYLSDENLESPGHSRRSRRLPGRARRSYGKTEPVDERRQETMREMAGYEERGQETMREMAGYEQRGQETMREMAGYEDRGGQRRRRAHADSLEDVDGYEARGSHRQRRAYADSFEGIDWHEERGSHRPRKAYADSFEDMDGNEVQERGSHRQRRVHGGAEDMPQDGYEERRPRRRRRTCARDVYEPEPCVQDGYEALGAHEEEQFSDEQENDEEHIAHGGAEDMDDYDERGGYGQRRRSYTAAAPQLRQRNHSGRGEVERRRGYEPRRDDYRAPRERQAGSRRANHTREEVFDPEELVVLN